MRLDDLTIGFRHLDRDRLLDDWGWLIGDKKKPVLITATGNAFVQDMEDFSIWFLNTATAEMVEIVEGSEGFKRALGHEAFISRFFDVEIVSQLRATELLAAGKVYSYKVPPALGGAWDASNFEPGDIEVHFSVSGQIYRQLRDLPPGTRIESIEFE